jgi:hypothetical protein
MRRTMNLVITIDELDMGGAQHVVYELLKNIDTEKYAITIICTDGRVHSLLENKILEESVKKKFSVVFLRDHFLKKINTPFIILNKIINRNRQITIDLTIIPELSKNL